MKKQLLSLLFSCFLLVFSNAQSIPVATIEYQALVDFYNDMGGSGWNTKWDINNNTIHQGDWTGVKSENGHIVEITLRSNNYRGNFPATFANLRYLKKLDIGGYYRGNDLSQANLDILAGLESLEYLDLSYSKIKSEFPKSWAKLTSLKELNLYYNEFYGSLPNEFGELKNLEKINSQNNLFEAFPKTISNLDKLKDLNFSYNKIENVNKEFENISTLKNLNLGSNNITDIFAILPRTVYFYVNHQVVYHDNFVFGGDDVVLNNLPNITKYSRTKNDFSERNNFRVYLRGSDVGAITMNADGSIVIPKSYISSIRKDDEIYLYQANGSTSGTRIYFKNITINQPTVPDLEYQALVDFYNAANGKNWYNKWDITTNNLHEGAWYGVSIENGHIVELNLSGNNLSGEIPASFSNLKYLRKLNINGNYSYRRHNFSTANLNHLSELELLESLDISYAQLKGDLPETLGNLVKLKYLNVSYNELTGLFSSIGNLKDLVNLTAINNQISAIPTEIGKALQVQNIHLQNNKIKIIIKELENLPNLKQLYLHYNEISQVVAKLPSSVNLPLYYQTNYIENLEYKGEDVLVTELAEITRYSRTKNDFSERNNFRVYLRGSDVGAITMNADGSIVIPKSYISSIRKDDEIYLYQANGSTSGTRIYFKNITINQPTVPDLEYQALVDFYNAANGKNWYNKWDITTNNLHEGAWYGVSIENGHIVELNLSGNNLSGEIPASFSNLKYLRKLNINGNYSYRRHNFSTANLNHLSELELLESLDISYAQLKGDLPETLGNLVKLKYLNVSYNELTGLFSSIGNLKDLVSLSAQSNKLKVLQKEFETLSNLTTLNLYSNNIANVEALLPRNVNLSLYSQTLEINPFEYIGEDVTITNMPNITKYNRNENTFNLKSRFYVYLRGSQIGTITMSDEGNVTIPKTMLSSIKTGDEVYLHQIDGSSYSSSIYMRNIPVNLPQIPDAEYQALVDFYNSANGKNWYNKWDVTTNNLHEGAWYGLRIEDGHIVGLVLGNNNLKGLFPESFKNLKHLKTLAISYADFSNANLELLGELPNLEYIDFNYAKINAAIPVSWSKLSNLRQLHVYNSNILNVDDSFKNLILTNYNFQYQTLNISSIEIGANEISYDLPLYMMMNITTDGKITFDAKNQFSLYVNNQYVAQSFATLDGKITFANTSSLKIKTTDKIRIYQNNGISRYSNIYFDSVTLGSPIPESEYQALVKLFDSTNGENWVNKWNTTENNLHLTSWFGVGIKGGHVVSINLPNNNLTKSLPEEIADFPNLKILNLQNNHLTGNLPNNIGNLSLLEVLDVNTNQLSGELPLGIASLQKLVKFSIANNKFQGEIPTFLSDFAVIQHLDISSNKFNNIVKKLYYDFSKTYIDLRNQRIDDDRVLNLDGTKITVKLGDISRYSLEDNNYDALNTFVLLVDNIAHSQATTNAAHELMFENIKISEIPTSAQISIRQLTGSFKDTEFFFIGLKDGSSVPVLEEEYQAIISFYNSLEGENWTNKWSVESNNIHTERWYGISINEGHIISIVLPYNNLKGTLPNIWAKLPYLEKLDVSGNSITDMEAKLPQNIEFISDRQTTDLGAIELDVDAVITIPTFNRYEHSSGLFAPQTYHIFIGDVNKTVTISEQGLRLMDIQSIWKISNPQSIELRQISGSARNSVLRYNLVFKLGDSNMDNAINVFDIQTTLNYILQNRVSFFNRSAADLNSDNKINVLDIVKLVNQIQTLGSTPTTGKYANHSAKTASETQKVELSIENGKLIMDTKSYTVASFEIILKNTDAANIKELISNLGYTVSVKNQVGQVSILAYSMTSELNGRIELAETTSPDVTISSAMLSDIQANEIPYEIITDESLSTGNLVVSQSIGSVINYPNPFVDETTIELTSDTSGKAFLEVYDISGKRVVGKTFVVNKGRNTQLFKRDILESGLYVYIIKVEGSTKVFTGKMIVK
ncbi:MAG: T9SS type A sorting domain-containing protein [Cruoricaptor ignavus]|nr:T9SS type A sorting domain-containing protein [Cruoricaptor ignavus]